MRDSHKRNQNRSGCNRLKFLKLLFFVALSFVLSACGPVKDFKDQLTERIVGQDPIDPPADLKDIKAKLNQIGRAHV